MARKSTPPSRGKAKKRQNNSADPMGSQQADQAVDAAPEGASVEAADATSSQDTAAAPVEARNIPDDAAGKLPDDEPPPVLKTKAIRKHHQNARVKNKTSKHRIAALERAIEATEYRAMGYSYREIAEFCGYSSQQGAHQAVTSVLKAAQKDAAEQLLDVELERLDKMLAGLWQTATGGDVMAIDAALKIMQRRAALLGMDKPIKVASTNPEGTEQAGPSWADVVAQAQRITADARGSGSGPSSRPA